VKDGTAAQKLDVGVVNGLQEVVELAAAAGRYCLASSF
jgi:hypothetical protein